MNAEFNVWLLIVGLVVGIGLTWVVTMHERRQEADIDAAELPREAAWLSAVLAEDGYDVSPEAAEQLLLLHRAYLGAPPPDPVPDLPPESVADFSPETVEPSAEAEPEALPASRGASGPTSANA